MKKGWEIKKLGEVCNKITDGSHNPPRGVDFSNFMMLSSKNIFDDLIHFEGPRYLTKKDFESENKRTEIKCNDVLLTIVGTIGRVAVVNQNQPNFSLQRSVAVLKIKEEILDSRFLMFSLQNLLKFLIDKSRGVAQKGIYLNQLKEIEIPVPPLQEQQRIVSILDEAFAAINQAKENLQRNLKNAKELFQSELNTIFTKKGEGWVEKRLGEEYDVRDGTHDSPTYQPKGFALITSKNLKNDELNFENVSYITEEDYNNINKRSKVDKGDILFAMIGTIGNPVVIKEAPDFAIKNVALFKVSNKQNSYFLKYFLDASMVINKMKAEAKGTTQKFVGLGYLRDFKILIPPRETQKQIVRQLDTLSAETKKLESKYQQKLDSLEELKKSILEKAFNGEL